VTGLAGVPYQCVETQALKRAPPLLHISYRH